jgi:hypothetical protein
MEDEPSEDTEEGDDLPEGEDEDGGPYEGSQYSSEGEEFEFEFEYDDIGLQEEGGDDNRRGVHMYTLRI